MNTQPCRPACEQIIAVLRADLEIASSKIAAAEKRGAEAMREKCAALVDERHDINEPWMNGDDIRLERRLERIGLCL